MKKLQIFADQECKNKVDGILYEGRRYYMIFPTENAELIKATLLQTGLTEFVSWHPRNTIATLRIVNRVGLVRIFGRLLDIRSEKLLESETGERQFQIILDDLASLSRHVLFDRTAGPSAYRGYDASIKQPSLLERFNYYRQACSPSQKRPGLKKMIEWVLQKPHSRLVDQYIWDNIWNLKRPSVRAMSSLFSSKQEFMILPEEHLYSTNVRGWKNAVGGTKYLPLKILRTNKSMAIDTVENRFVKHVLFDITNVCFQVIRQKLVSGGLYEKAEQLLSLSRGLLSLDFFKNIGKLKIIPHSSPALKKSIGYREIYKMYIRSYTASKHLFEDLAEESLFVELKDIALLYEYWVFYKVSVALFESGAFYLSRDAIVKEGRIINSAKVTDGNVTVYFNQTFSRKTDGSYSLSFRPDIIVEVINHTKNKPLRFILDAKYKVALTEKYNSEPDLSLDPDSLLLTNRVVKPEDIHKMHCYVDAIDEVCSAVIVYPGTEFIFYPRDRTRNLFVDSADFDGSNGVGAVPLLPGRDSLLFDDFMKRLKEYR